MTDGCHDEVIAAGLPTTNDNLWAVFVERVRKVRVWVRVSVRLGARARLRLA